MTKKLTKEEYAGAKPIMFSTKMVQALMDGRKTMTRRPIKGDLPKKSAFGYTALTPKNKISCRGNFEFNGEDKYGEQFIKIPYPVGTVLYVKETWSETFGANGHFYLYKADGEHLAEMDGVKWKSSMFMPKKAARLFYRVTNVRVENIQDITPNDVYCEGVGVSFSTVASFYYDEWSSDQKYEFKKLWNSIYAKKGYGWETNCPVFVYGLEKLEI